MSGQLESALVVTLRETIKWESSLNATPDGNAIASTGTLYPVDQTAVFNPLHYQYRDRQLAYRDLINAAAVVEVSVQVSDVWNYSAIKPSLQGPVETQMPQAVDAGFTANGTNSMVRHVKNVSIPYDAARYADTDLYGRDLLIYETLARACAATFTNPSISRIDSHGTIFPNTAIWSLAEGASTQADINPALRLERDTFKTPDQNLADRDNQLAGYTARLAQVLKNPFEFATRLYVRVSVVDEREPEVYVFSAEDTTNRTWVADPALSDRNRIVYNKLLKTLTWTREHTDEIHVPQLYAMSIPGIEPGQTLDTLPDIPDRQDAQFYRSKASALIPMGGSLSDAIDLAFTASSATVGGYMQVPAASLTVPDTLTITIPGTIQAGLNRVSVLVVPNPVVEIAGASNVSNTSGTLGGATFEVDVASGGITTKSYFVDGGDGIVYNGVTYAPGTTFGGQSGTTTYTQAGSVASKVRQYSVAWNLALPPGAWSLQIDYTNLQNDASAGFGVTAQYAASGALPVDIIKDTIPLPFSGTNGDVVTSLTGGFDVVSSDPFKLPIFWTYGTGQLHIRKLTIENTHATDCRIGMTGTIDTAFAVVDVVGTRAQPEILMFDMTTGSNSPVALTLSMLGDASTDTLLPLQIKQVQIQSVGTYNATPLADAFQGWRHECIERTERTVQQSFNQAVVAFGTEFPNVYTSGTTWGPDNSDDWMSIIEVYHPRLRELPDIDVDSIVMDRQYEVTSGVVSYGGGNYQPGQRFYGIEESGTSYSGGVVKQVGAFALSKPGHLGKPCLVPLGLEFGSGMATAINVGTQCVPVIAACQPWMIDAGLYTAQVEFWTPDHV